MNRINYTMDPEFINIIFMVRNILLNVVADDKKGLITFLLFGERIMLSSFLCLLNFKNDHTLQTFIVLL